MTDPAPVQPEHDVLPPEPAGTLSVPPPVPQKKPGLLRRLFTSRKKQQAVAIQNGYLEMVDLIRAIRSHLDRQENVQTSLLTMLEKVPDVMERQHEVMAIFKQQLENGMENNRRLTDSMGNLNNTLSGMDESQKASSRTITDLIHRSRESEQLLREVMRRSERRMTALVVFFFLAVVALGFYFVRGPDRPATVSGAPPAIETGAEKPAKPAGAEKNAVAEKPEAPEKEAEAPVSEKAAFIAPAKPAKEEKAAEATPAPAKKDKAKKKSKAEPKSEEKSEPVPAPPPAEGPAIGQPDLTLEQLRPAMDAEASPADQPVSKP